MTDSDNESQICGKQACTCKEINVLDQSDYSLIIGMIDSIEDPILKANFIRQVQQKITKTSTHPSKPVEENKPVTSSIVPDFDQNVLRKFHDNQKKITIPDLQKEIQTIKKEIKDLKIFTQKLQQSLEDSTRVNCKPKSKQPSFKSSSDSDSDNISKSGPEQTLANILCKNETEHTADIINTNKAFRIQKWYCDIDIRISSDYNLRVNALIDSGADQNCIKEGLVPTKYLEKTTESLYGANKQKLDISYKLTNARVCNSGVCYNSSFLMVKTLSQNVILGLPFLYLITPFTTTNEGLVTEYLGKEILFPFTFPVLERELNSLKNTNIGKDDSIFLEQQVNDLNMKENHLSFLKDDLRFERQKKYIEETKTQQKIKELKSKLEKEVCSSFPNAFWDRKKHIVNLPYNKDFSKKGIPTKARPIQMTLELLLQKRIPRLITKRTH